MHVQTTFPANSSENANESPQNSRAMALPRIAYSVHDAAIVSGLSRSKLYELMKSGALPSVKLGARRLIRHADLAAVFDQEVSNG